jgi:hypothetical protein
MFAYRINTFDNGSFVVMAESASQAFSEAVSYLYANGWPHDDVKAVRRSRAANPVPVKRCTECHIWQLPRERRYNHMNWCQSQFAYSVGDRVEFQRGDGLHWESGVVLHRKRAGWTGDHRYTVSDVNEMDSVTLADWWLRKPPRYSVACHMANTHNWHNRYGPSYVLSGFVSRKQAREAADLEMRRFKDVTAYVIQSGEKA